MRVSLAINSEKEREILETLEQMGFFIPNIIRSSKEQVILNVEGENEFLGKICNLIKHSKIC